VFVESLKGLAVQSVIEKMCARPRFERLLLGNPLRTSYLKTR
jgi:hypothetical protein